MNILAIVAAVLALSMYVPLCIQLWTGKISQNLATFILWGLLDGIAAGSIYLQGGNYLLPAFYVLGCIAVIASIIKARCVRWTRIETVTAIMVLVCIVVWYFVGNMWATIVSTLAVATAGIPQLIDTWRRPEESAPFTYVGFTVANLLTVVAGKDWSIAERFYPGVCTILTLAFVVLAFRKFQRHRQSAIA